MKKLSTSAKVPKGVPLRAPSIRVNKPTKKQSSALPKTPAPTLKTAHEQFRRGGKVRGVK